MKNPDLRGKVTGMLASLSRKSSPSLLGSRPSIRERIPVTCERLDARLSYNAWWAAPAAGLHSHHPYPGGWLIHHATNLGALRGLIKTAREVRGLGFDADVLLAAMLLHDWAKPRMLVWRENKLESNEGEVGHHVTALAEVALRGLPRDVLVCLAGVHSGWWKQPDAVRQFLEKAGEIIDQPILGEWAREEEATRRVSGWIIRQGEESWYAAARHAVQVVREPLRECLAEYAEGSQLDALEYLVWGWADEMELADVYLSKGPAALGKRAKTALKEAEDAFEIAIEP